MTDLLKTNFLILAPATKPIQYFIILWLLTRYFSLTAPFCWSYLGHRIHLTSAKIILDFTLQIIHFDISTAPILH